MSEYDKTEQKKPKKEPTIGERALMVCGGMFALVVSLNIFFPGVLPHSNSNSSTQTSYEASEQHTGQSGAEAVDQLQEEESVGAEGESSSEEKSGESEPTESNESEATTSEKKSSLEPPDDIAKKLPYENMPEAWIELTYLGKPDGIKENEELRIKLPHQKGSTWSRYEDALTTYYYWSAQNGTDDRIFAAYCYRGKVVKITKFNVLTTYWPDGIDGLPDRSADGSELKLSSDRATEANRLDPFDYDNGEDYADDAEWWYEKRGYSNPWAEALEYWDTNGPLDSETEY